MSHRKKKPFSSLSTSLSIIMRSIILHKTEVKVIGLWELGLSAGLSGFTIWIITACFHSLGRHPPSTTLLIRASVKPFWISRLRILYTTIFWARLLGSTSGARWIIIDDTVSFDDLLFKSSFFKQYKTNITLYFINHINDITLGPSRK